MITVPTLLVDEQKCRTNIRRMVEKCRTNNLAFRPHFKTHQSHEIGRWFREEGVTKITCSSLSMAQYFAEDGWNDITVAFPVNVLEIATINELAWKIKLNLLVESVEAVEILQAGLQAEVGLFIKLDIGTHRTGMNPTDHGAIRKVIVAIRSSDKTSFKGFLAHAGHSYGCRSNEEILEVHRACMQIVADIKAAFADVPNWIFSYGDTPTCSIADSFPGVDELRPGNFVFYDFMQWQITSCSEEQIGVAVACPVVAKHPERNEVVVYGGGVHFSKDVMEINGQKVFGKAVADAGDKWGKILPEVMLVRLSQEHGILHAPTNYIANLKIGDVIKILPVHSCMTMDLLREFRVV